MDPIISHLLAGIGGATLGVLVTWLLLRRGRVDGAEAEKRLNEYRQEVAEHFARTSALVDSMTDSYKAVFDELQEGAHRLMDPDELQNLLEDRSDEVITLSRLSYREAAADSAAKSDEKATPEADSAANTAADTAPAAAESKKPAADATTEKEAVDGSAKADSAKQGPTDPQTTADISSDSSPELPAESESPKGPSADAKKPAPV